MPNPESIDPAVYEWQPCTLWLPRIALKATRSGTYLRLLLPGRYMVRRSHSLGRVVYRRFSG